MSWAVRVVERLVDNMVSEGELFVSKVVVRVGVCIGVVEILSCRCSCAVVVLWLIEQVDVFRD